MAGDLIFRGDLNRHNFSKQDLRGVVFESAELYRASFASANLEGAYFVSCFAAEADFTSADCAGLRAHRSSFYRACFRGADLTEAQFLHCVLAHSDLRGATLRRLTLTLDCNSLEEIRLGPDAAAELAYLFGRANSPHRLRWLDVVGDRDLPRLDRIFSR